MSSGRQALPYRARALIEQLGLEPHPEGGFYAEVFRSNREVHPADPRSTRAALTTIYFLLARGQYSRWHRVASDEVWHFYEGDPVELCWIDTAGHVRRETLGQATSASRPVRVVPADCWQSARPLGDYGLVGCTVGPGFDFEDFEMADPGSDAWRQLRDSVNLPEDWPA